MGDDEAVLAANESFYRAFAEGDAEALEALWAVRAPVACIHPGWAPLAGRDLVMQSWRAILAAGPPPISCREPSAHVLGEAAFVVCFEVIDEGLLAATNVFVREAGAWRMVHHQAGPTALAVPDEAGGKTPEVLH